MQLSLFFVSALGALAAEYQGHEMDGYVFKPVQEVYGSVTPTAAAAYQTYRSNIFKELGDKIASETKSRGAAARWFGDRGGTASNQYEHERTPENCVFPIDLLLLQDATGSFQVDFELTVNNTLPAIDKVLPTRHPKSHISFVSFKDKPFNTLGEVDDYCIEVHALNEDNASALRPHYEHTPVGGGYDYPENQYGALVAALKSPTTIPWNQDPLATKVVVMVTDAQPHFGGDSQQRNYPFLKDWGNGYDEQSEEVYCKQRYYPTPATVKNAIHDTRTYFSTIIVRPNDPTANPLPAWQWFNSFVGFPPAFVQASTDVVEGWFQQLLEILEAIEKEECVFVATTTTTPEPKPTTTTEEEILTTTTPEPKPTTTTEEEIRTTSSKGTDNESTTDGENNCVCPPTNPNCCQKAPEVLIALMERPEKLDIHLVGLEKPSRS